MFHKRSVQDILYEWTPRGSPPTALPVSHLILFLRLLFSSDKVREPWKQAAQRVPESEVGSPTFSHPEGGLLTGDISQHDGKQGRARGDCLQAEKERRKGHNWLWKTRWIKCCFHAKRCTSVHKRTPSIKLFSVQLWTYSCSTFLHTYYNKNLLSSVIYSSNSPHIS